MQNLNFPTYNLAATTTSQSITLSPQHVPNNFVSISNMGASSLFVQSGTGAVTAVYPASSLTAFTNGAVIPANSTLEFKKNPNHETLAIIRSAGTGDVSIKVGAE